MQALARHKTTGPIAFVALLLLCWALPAGAAAQPAYRGIQVHSLWSDRTSAEMSQELDLTQQLGSNVVRVDIGWSTLEEQGKGNYTKWYLDKIDRFMQEAGDRQLKVVATLLSTPCWASSAPESLKQSCSGQWWNRGVQNYPPINAADYGDAVRFITSRYGSRLAAFEVWNEPNLERFLVAPDQASAYASLVRAAYPAAKEGNAGVPVIAGALAAADRPFLEALYARGIKGYYDAISIHPYNEWRDPYDRWRDQWKKYTFLPGIEWVHEAQIAAGDDKPLWITEFGWNTCSPAVSNWCVDEARQADYSAKAWQILNTLGYVQGATMYELRDEGSDPNYFEGNWGLVREDFSPKPAFAAVQAALNGVFPGAAASSDLELVSLEIDVRGTGAVVATGKAPRSRTLAVRLHRCDQGRKKLSKRWIKVNRHGRYRGKLGIVNDLQGCGVTVKVKRTRRTATSRVPGLQRVGTAQAVS